MCACDMCIHVYTCVHVCMRARVRATSSLHALPACCSPLYRSIPFTHVICLLLRYLPFIVSSHVTRRPPCHTLPPLAPPSRTARFALWFAVACCWACCCLLLLAAVCFSLLQLVCVSPSRVRSRNRARAAAAAAHNGLVNAAAVGESACACDSLESTRVSLMRMQRRLDSPASAPAGCGGSKSAHMQACA